MKFIKWILVLVLAVIYENSSASENKNLKLCVFDIIGKSGPLYMAMQDYKLEAARWGVTFDVNVLTDEKIATEEFKGGTCDAAAISGFRSRSFNSFTGTIDAFGAIPSYDLLRVVLEKLSSPNLSSLMKNGEYEIAGVIPSGAAYLFGNDRQIDTVNELAGTRIAVLDFEKSIAVMVGIVGASPITVTMSNMGSMFNNGAVDIIPVSLTAYEPLELRKGIGTKGGIANYAIAQLTTQIILRSSRFPDGFGQQSRQYIYSQFDKDMARIMEDSKSINNDIWIEISDNDKNGYQEMFRQSRIKMREMGIYDRKMLAFLSRVRCAVEPVLAECTANDRE